MKRPNKISNILELTSTAVETGRIVYTEHANKRLLERDIEREEVEFVLLHGHHEAQKDQFHDEYNSWDYAIRGTAFEDKLLRIIVAVKDPHIVVVTAIDLEKKD